MRFAWHIRWFWNTLSTDYQTPQALRQFVVDHFAILTECVITGQTGIDEAFEQLVRNLADDPISLPLISQYLPLQYSKVRVRELIAIPHELIID